MSPTFASPSIAALRVGQSLPEHHLIARNYAEHSVNRMHGDDVAPLYGFAGGLVPGIANYAYMTRLAVSALGREWLARGSISARFMKPLYQGERATVRAIVNAIEPPRLKIELLNPSSGVVGSATATLPVAPPVALAAADYPPYLQWAGYRLLPTEHAVVPEGMLLAMQQSRVDIRAMQEAFLDMVGDDLPIYRGPDAPCHPAALLTRANDMLKFNFDLGPWIHAGSDVQNHAMPLDGEIITARGRVSRSYEKAGHGFVELDLGFFGESGRSIMRVLHHCIVRPRRKA